MCLHGNDIDENTTPVEAGLSWVIGKDRRIAGDFIGSKTVLDQLKNGPPKRRVGLIVEEAPARRTHTLNLNLFFLNLHYFRRREGTRTRNVRRDRCVSSPVVIDDG